MTTVLERCGIMSVARDILAFEGTNDKRDSLFQEYKATYPKLYGILVSGRCDLRHLEIMFSNMDMLEKGNITLEMASKKVSDDLNQTYIESVLPKPTLEQLRKVSEREAETQSGKPYNSTHHAQPDHPDNPECLQNTKKRSRSNK